MKAVLKKICFIFAYILVIPFTAVSNLEKKLMRNSEIFFNLFGHILGLIPGKIGFFFRAAYYKGTIEECSYDTRLNFRSFVAHRTAKIGRNIDTGAYCIIGCADIGDNVMLASRVSITSGKRQHLNNYGKIIKSAKYTTVKIGKNSWIGEGAIVMDDVGENCIVSAGSVVTKEIPDNHVAVGNPARAMNLRKKNKDILSQ